MRTSKDGMDEWMKIKGNRECGYIDSDVVKDRVDLRCFALAVQSSFLPPPDERWRSLLTGDITTRCPRCQKKRSYVIYRDGFYCHHCSYSGNIFSYVMEQQGCDFYTALQCLARFAGL